MTNKKDNNCEGQQSFGPLRPAKRIEPLLKKPVGGVAGRIKPRVGGTRHDQVRIDCPGALTRAGR